MWTFIRMYNNFFNEGWMETSTFASWFELFKNTIKECPVLLLFDGHMTHFHTSNQDSTGGKHNHLQVSSTCNKCYAAARCDMFWTVKEALGK